MTTSIRLDNFTEHQIEKIKDFYQNEMPFKGKVTKTEVIKISIHNLFNEIFNDQNNGH